MTSIRRISSVARAMALPLAFAAVCGVTLNAQSPEPAEHKRAVKHLVQPVLPDLARKLNLTGAVRIEVTIGPDGIVKRSRVLGGHPVLAAEAQRAADKSTFEPGPKETVEVLDYKF